MDRAGGKIEDGNKASQLAQVIGTRRRDSNCFQFVGTPLFVIRNDLSLLLQGLMLITMAKEAPLLTLSYGPVTL